MSMQYKMYTVQCYFSPVLSVCRFAEPNITKQFPIMSDDTQMSVPDQLKLQDERIKSLECLPDEVKNQGAKLDEILEMLKAQQSPPTGSPITDERVDASEGGDCDNLLSLFNDNDEGICFYRNLPGQSTLFILALFHINKLG